MKAEDLAIGQHCVFVDKGMAGVFQAVERDPKYPDQIPVKEITLDTNTGKYPRISLTELGLRPNDEVIPLRGIGHCIT